MAEAETNLESQISLQTKGYTHGRHGGKEDTEFWLCGIVY